MQKASEVLANKLTVMRVVHLRSKSGVAPATSMTSEEREIDAFRVLVDRCRSLEEKQAKLREEFDELVQEKKVTLRDDEEDIFKHFKLRLVGLQALELEDPVRITLRKLYGWKDYEIIGQTVAKTLVAEENYASLQKILARLIKGIPWSGQFPLKKKFGEVFMAMVTKTPLYEDGELVGVITVSSDAAILNSKNSENQRTYRSGAKGQPGVQRSNFKRIQWPQRPMIAPIPQIASSVSNLASKFLPLRRTDDTISRNTSTDADDEKLEKRLIYEAKPYSRHHHKENPRVAETPEKDESITECGQPSKIAARVLAKLQIRGAGKCGKDNGSIKNNCRTDNSGSNRVNNQNDSSGDSVPLTPHQDVAANGADKEENHYKCNSSMKRTDTKVCTYGTSNVLRDSSSKPFSGEWCECFVSPIPQDPLSRLRCQFDQKKLEPKLNTRNMVTEDEVQKHQEGLQLPSSRGSIGSHESSSSKGDSELNSVV